MTEYFTSGRGGQGGGGTKRNRKVHPRVLLKLKLDDFKDGQPIRWMVKK